MALMSVCPVLTLYVITSGRDVAAYRVDITVCEEKNFPPSDTQLYKDLYVMRIKENPKYNEWRVSLKFTRTLGCRWTDFMIAA